MQVSTKSEIIFYPRFNGNLDQPKESQVRLTLNPLSSEELESYRSQEFSQENKVTLRYNLRKIASKITKIENLEIDGKEIIEGKSLPDIRSSLIHVLLLETANKLYRMEELEEETKNE